MRSEARSRGGVSEWDSRSEQTHEPGATDGRYVARLTSVNVPERVNEGATGSSACSTARRKAAVVHIGHLSIYLAREATWPALAVGYE
jgi:hypothetical protein